MKYLPNTGKVLGDPPKDRKLISGERIAWNGEVYFFFHRRCHDVGATGLYTTRWEKSVDKPGDFVGPCETLFEAERLLGLNRIGEGQK